MDMLYFFLPGIILLGIITSYEDIRGRGIRNKWVLLGLVYAFAVFSALVGYLMFSGSGVSPGYLGDYFLNVLIALAFGYIIWHVGLWSAGDAKLFLAYSALVPLSVYSIGYIAVFPSLTVFINTLVLILIFLIVGLLVKTGIRQKFEVIKKTFHWRLFSVSIISLFGLSWLIRMLFLFFRINYDLFTFLVLIPVIYVLISGIFRKNMKWVYLVLMGLRILFDYNYILSLQFLQHFGFMIVFYILIRYFIFGLSYELFSRPVSIERLEAGMIPAESIYREGKRYVKQEHNPLGILKEKTRGEEIFSKRHLSREDIKKLSKLHMEGKINSELRIHSTMPFAIFMFLGVLLTLAFQGNILMALRFLLLG